MAGGGVHLNHSRSACATQHVQCTCTWAAHAVAMCWPCAGHALLTIQCCLHVYITILRKLPLPYSLTPSFPLFLPPLPLPPPPPPLSLLTPTPHPSPPPPTSTVDAPSSQLSSSSNVSSFYRPTLPCMSLCVQITVPCVHVSTQCLHATDSSPTL